MYNIARRVALAAMIGLALVLAGCIQPISEVDQTKTAQATMGFVPFSAAPSATPPPVDAGSDAAASATAAPQLPVLIDQFVRGRGDAPGSLQVWHDAQQGIDRLVGFSYNGLSGTSCAGFAVLASPGGVWQLTDSGALFCTVDPSAEAFAANTFFLTSDGQPNTIVFGRVNNASVSTVRVLFDDGNSQAVNVAMGGFLVVKPGVASPTTLIGVDAQGNVILSDIQHSPV